MGQGFQQYLGLKSEWGVAGDHQHVLSKLSPAKQPGQPWDPTPGGSVTTAQKGRSYKAIRAKVQPCLLSYESGLNNRIS